MLQASEVNRADFGVCAGLRLGGANIHTDNFYWLSTKPETLDWPKSDWYHTPTTSFADYTALNSLPPVELKVASETSPRGDDRVTTVTVTNPSIEGRFST